MKDRARIMYIRDNHKQPCGCLAISIDRNKGRVEYALSVRHPSDAYVNGKKVNFDRKAAQLLSLRRLVEEPKRLAIDPEATQHEVTEAVMRDIVVCGEAPTRASRFARRWLQSVSEMFVVENFSMTLPR